MRSNSSKTAVVTGASSGIGKASAEALAQAGYTVFGTSRRPGIGSNRVTMRECDVTDDASVQALISSVLLRTGRIDVLVNNAGLGLFGGAEESSIGQVKDLFDVNFFGTARVTNAALPAMRQRGRGRIINISSILGLIPAPYSAYYAATKHALEGYSESLDHELRAFNIRVSLIEPAYTRSVFDRNALKPDAQLNEYDQARAGTDALLKDVMPKADPPELVADVVLRAATDRNPRRRYTAGEVARQINLLRRFAPASMFDRTLRKELRLPA